MKKVQRSSVIDTYFSMTSPRCEDIETCMFTRCHHYECRNRNRRGEIDRAISWRWDGPSALLSDRYRRTDGQAGMSNRPFDSNRWYAFPWGEAFHIRQASKMLGVTTVRQPNLSAVAFLQQF